MTKDLALPIPVRFEFVQYCSIAVFEDQMEFVLSFGLEHFDQIHQVFVFQMLKCPRRRSESTSPPAGVYFQHADLSHGDSFDRRVVVGLDELLDRHCLPRFLVPTFEDLS